VLPEVLPEDPAARPSMATGEEIYNPADTPLSVFLN
jgi:hypothetical protein